MNLPKHINLANLPTKIERLERFFDTDKNIYIKRDDQTGSELSGNKVRKLEFAIQEALDLGAKTLITCGGIQSNHARATAAAAKKLGLNCILVLRADEDHKPDGNYFLDLLLGAEIRLIGSEDFSNKLFEILEDIKKECDDKGEPGYILPVGASNGIGAFGYVKAMEEIAAQEKEMGITFDTIVCTVGSAGTYAGLLIANKILGLNKKIVGFSVSDSTETFTNRTKELFQEASEYLNEKVDASEDIIIYDDYVGLGYAISRPEEIEFIRDFASTEGIILDPVYTGKCMYGFSEELKKGKFEDSKNILFIHTGGIFGLFPAKDLF